MIKKFLTLITLSSTALFGAEQTFDQLLKARISGISFDSKKPVTQQQLIDLAEAAKQAPSSYNDQPWFFIFCDRTTNPTAYDKLFNTLVESNQKWVKNAPLLVLVVAAMTTPSRNNQPNRWGQYDTGAAASFMMLKATSMGLMAHQMGGFDQDKATQAFALPKDTIPMAVMAVGTPSETPQPKPRKPTNDNFFNGSWGKGLK